MNTSSAWTGRSYRRLGGIAMIATLVVLVGALTTTPARADDDERGRNVQQHQKHDNGRRPAHRPYRYDYGYSQPNYVYAPPPVYYAPPPRPPAIDFVFPLNFR